MDDSSKTRDVKEVTSSLGLGHLVKDHQSIAELKQMQEEHDKLIKQYMQELDQLEGEKVKAIHDSFRASQQSFAPSQGRTSEKLPPSKSFQGMTLQEMMMQREQEPLENQISGKQTKMFEADQKKVLSESGGESLVSAKAKTNFKLKLPRKIQSSKPLLAPTTSSKKPAQSEHHNAELPSFL